MTRPLLLRTEAAEDGREIMLVRTAGGESLSTATNTPHLGGHVKYLMLITVADQDRLIVLDGGTAYPFTLPSFLPLPLKPPPSSTPAHSPGLPSIDPTKRRTPSNPKDSILTASPTSNCLPARLTLRPWTLDCLLAELAGVGLFWEEETLLFTELTAETEDATDEGLVEMDFPLE